MQTIIQDWKPIKGLPYLISNTGLVKNKLGKILKQYIEKKGYCRVRLCQNYVKFNFRVHRLVALAFVPNSNPEKFKQINHKDANKRNNNADNLEWTDSLGNIRHACALGIAGSFAPGKSPGRKLMPDDVKWIRDMLRSGMTHRAIAKLFGMNHSTIGDISRGQIWRHII